MLKKFIIIAIASISMIGCSKDPKDISQKDKYSSGEYPKSLADLTGILGAAYGNYRSTELAGFQLNCKIFVNSEHAADLAYGGDAGWTELAFNKLSVSNGNAQDLWRGLYVGVKQTNAFLERATFFEKNFMAPSEQQMVNYMRGEAYFLRAYYYFLLECFFGETYIRNGQGGEKMGVPIYTEIPKTLAETQQPRKTVREVWDFIINDLKQSASLLEGAVWSGSSKGRASKWSAKALLGKAYVFTQDWPNAKTTLLEVISSSGKSLMPFAKYKDAFNGNPANEFNEESLFEINVDRVAAGYGVFGDFPNKNLTTTQGVIWAPSCVGTGGTEDGGDNTLGYSNEFVHDKNLLRFGFNLPIYTLVANPNYNPALPASPTNTPQVMDPVTMNASKAMRANKTVDPRLYVNALQPWVDTVKMGGVLRPVAKCSNIGAGIRQFFQGWSFKKYQTIDDNVHAYNAADASNLYILRLADVYLLYAEACMNSGDNPTALEYINKVKRRAYDYPVNAASPVDYASLTAATKAPDANLANNPLRYERYAELFAEGHWWFDVGRWRIGAGEAAYFNVLLPTGGASQWSENRSYSFPIPFSEISTNTQLAGQQNPGY
ncbi:MAG: RagB/SusD family nutrient uptake outer membrane protein [Chitinophagaceae bacterium]|nr:RagB/SusD family nutrient uptake outer membrane protein [Chitinophagaceae bacterium]